ncbi:MAG: phosphoribosylglycinamide formyltransferase [Bacteroidales bacterium]
MKNAQFSGKIRLAMLASGSGTNVENFIHHFRNHSLIEIAVIITNNAHAGVLERAARAGIPAVVISRAQWVGGHQPLEVLHRFAVDYVILAGFLQLIDSRLIQAFPEKILNIHPALLPKYGGKGMYGMKVHQAVIQAGEAYSGISIHLVNEQYDQGQILFQSKVEVASDDTPECLAQKIHQLEYQFFPRVVEDYVMKRESQAEN